MKNFFFSGTIWNEQIGDRKLRTIVYTGPDYCVDLIEKRIGSLFKVVHVQPTSESLLPAFKECTVFLDASMKVAVDSKAVAAASSLRLVVTATTGANHIDSIALERRGIPLLTRKGQTEILHSLTPAAELTWALIMSAARCLRGAYRHVEDNGWNRVEFPGLMLKDKTIGIIGFGRIGRWIARYAQSFEMKILAYDPLVDAFPDYIKPTPLEELVAFSDIVTIHVHLSEETEEIVDARLISKFKDGAIFVNTSRGELTDEEAIVLALKSGKLSAVGVDVLRGEPDIESSPLWHYAQSHDNVHITPHIGGFCPDAVKNVVDFSCNRIHDYFARS